MLTHRLNKDALDNLFSQIRTRGGLNDHPTPLNALFRIRMTILGKNQCDLKNNQHEKEPEEAIFLTASVLKHVNATTDALTLREIGEKEDLTANESTSSVAIPSTSPWEPKSVEVALNGLESSRMGGEENFENISWFGGLHSEKRPH